MKRTYFYCSDELQL